jgi:2-oxo-3-hexenedioate decarboxylase
VTGTPVHETHCHCSICRRTTGAPFVTWFTVPADAFAFTAGSPTCFASSDHGRRSFCPFCGTQLTFQSSRAPGELDVTTCSLDEPERVPPKDHTQTGAMLSWVALSGGLPRFPEARGSATVDPAPIARELLDALDHGTTVASVAERHPDFGWDEGYRVAREIVRLRRARGERSVGRKIGFTHRGIWAEYGATAPIWAHVYDGTLVRAEAGRASVSLRGAVRPRLEAEIAFRLARPLAAGASDPAEILAAVEWVAASFEIVDCHFADWKFRGPESVADFALHWRLVVGPPHRVRAEEIPALAVQLRDCRVSLKRGDTEAGRGVGSNALGHPAGALGHLAEVLARQPGSEPLAAGEVITTGTLTVPVAIQPGDSWSSDYAGAPLAGITLALTD